MSQVLVTRVMETRAGDGDSLIGEWLHRRLNSEVLPVASRMDTLRVRISVHDDLLDMDERTLRHILRLSIEVLSDSIDLDSVSRLLEIVVEGLSLTNIWNSECYSAQIVQLGYVEVRDVIHPSEALVH